MINYSNFGAYNLTVNGRQGRSFESVYFSGDRAEPKAFDWTFPTSTAATETKNPLPFGTLYSGSGSSMPEAQGSTNDADLAVGFTAFSNARARDSLALTVDYLTSGVAAGRGGDRAGLVVDYVLQGMSNGRARVAPQLLADYVLVAFARGMASLAPGLAVDPNNTADFVATIMSRAVTAASLNADFVLRGEADARARDAAAMVADFVLAGQADGKTREQIAFIRDVPLTAVAAAVVRALGGIGFDVGLLAVARAHAYLMSVFESGPILHPPFVAIVSATATRVLVDETATVAPGPITRTNVGIN